MSGQEGTLELLGRHLALALQPLRDAVRDKERFRAFLYQLGWNASDLPPEYAALGTAIDDVTAKLAALEDPPTDGQISDLLTSIQNAYNAIAGISVAPPGVDAGAFLAEIGERLFEILLTDYLAREVPAAYSVLQALNVIQVEHVSATADRPSFVRVHFLWEEIPKIVTEPQKLPERVYGWGTPELDGDRILDHLAGLMVSLGFGARVRPAGEDRTRGYLGLDDDAETPGSSPSLIVPFFYVTIADKDLEAAFAVRELPAAGDKLPGLVLEPQIPQEFPLTLKLADTISLRVVAGTNAASQAGILVRPGEISVKYPFEPGTTPPSAGIGVGFDFKPAEPALLFGSRGATRLEFQGASIDLAARSVNGVFEAVAGGELAGLALVLSAGEGDSFLKSLIGEGETRMGLPLGVEWSSRFGVRFKGSAAFEVAVHPHLEIGPVSIEEITVRLAVPTEHPPDLVVELGAGISGQLGPIGFFLQGVGIKAGLTFSDGNLGPLDVRLGFKPPNGVGLSIGGGGFKGGGFLVYDSEKGEYAGGLELEFQDVIAVKAIGILDTKLPDGSKGYSLLILITAEFVPIQLGFGFTLNGVGGLLGVHRTVVTDALRAGIHDATLDSILFPKDIVANAARILSDLKRVFPPLPGHFLVGPMGKLGWGTPTLVSLELGIVIEIPRPGFVILGILRIALPVEDSPIVKLQVNFLGIVDFEKGQLSFDASLFDSHVLSFTLTGDMAVRFYWGENANLLLTVGGFHPAYTPPPMGLPALQRIALDLFPGKIRAEAYFAITSNTIQFGAKLEVSVGASVFNVYGFMALDVLVQRVPFHFIAEFTARLAVRSGSHTLFSVRIDATLEGPTPWHAHGTGSFEIGFVFTVTIHVHFDVTIGADLTSLLPILRVLPLLVEALEKAGNWRAVLPSGSSLSVALRELAAEADRLVLHPFGTLEISQKVAPLNLPIDRVGAQRVDNGRIFRISDVQVGGDAGGPPADSAREQFAPAQFLEMSDAEKLSRKSFENYDSGVRVGGGDRPAADYTNELDVAYEVIYVPEKKRPARFKLPQFFFDGFLRGSAVAQSPLSFEKRSPSGLGTAKIALAEEKFAVAAVSDLTLHGEGLVFDSEAEAHAALRSAVERDPALTQELQVVPLFEVNAA